MEPKLNNIIPIVLISWSFAFDFFFFPALQCSSESLCLLIFLEKPTSLEASVYTVVLQSPRWLSISISITLDIFSQSKVVVTFRAIYIFNHLSPWVALCLSISLSPCLSLSLRPCFSVCLCLSISFSLTFVVVMVPMVAMMMFSLTLGWLGSHKTHKGRQGENCEQLHVVSCLC